MVSNTPHIINFSRLDNYDFDVIGKRAHDLNKLILLNISIPDGFVILPSFFKDFLQETGLDAKIKKAESLMHPAIEDSREKLFEPIKKEIMRTHLPQNLSNELQRFYRKLSGILKEQSLNIYSSSKNNKSMVFRNVKGDANLVLKIKEIWTLQLHNPVAIIIQKNIKSASWHSKNKGKLLTNDPLISDQNLLRIAKKIQKHFYFPQEIDYVIEKDRVYITGIRPFTGIVGRTKRKILIKGISINPGIVTGHVKLINYRNFEDAKISEIIVTKSLNKSLFNKIKRAKAVVTDAVLQTSLDRLYYRKIIKAPTIIGAGNATKLLQNGNIITVNGVTGEIYSGGLI